MSEPLETCTCFAVEGSESYCSCGCSYCEVYCLPDEPEEFDVDDADLLGCGNPECAVPVGEHFRRECRTQECDHVNEREIAGGWVECEDCGRMV